MAKYRLLRERLLAERVARAGRLEHPGADRVGGPASRPRRGVHRGGGVGHAVARGAAADRVPMVADDGRALAPLGWRDAGGRTRSLARSPTPSGERCAGLAGGRQSRRRHAPRLPGSRRGLLRVQRRGGCRAGAAAARAPSPARWSSTATCIRATAPRRSSAAIRRCSRFSIHGENNYPFRKELSDSTSRSPMARLTPITSTALAAHVPRLLDDRQPDLVVLSRRRRSVRGRSARPVEADNRRPAGARPVRVRRLRRAPYPGRRGNERRLRVRR